jgi:hypothetical protein
VAKLDDGGDTENVANGLTVLNLEDLEAMFKDDASCQDIN